MGTKPPQYTKHRVQVSLTIVIPFLGLVLAVLLAVTDILPVTSVDVVLLIGSYILCMYGLELGYHRYFSHKSFSTKPWFACTLAVLGAMAGQGPPAYWVANHRLHHHHSDQAGDPHSPYFDSKGSPISGLRGFYHSHIGWLFSNTLVDRATYRDLVSRLKFLKFVEHYYLYWVVLGVLIPMVIGYILTDTLTGALSAFLWGGLARICLVQHAVWAVNSVGHLWGGQTYKNNAFSGKSRNNFFLALLTLGGGWHNNHHQFPNSAFNHHQWWQLDMTDLTIHFLTLCKLITSPKKIPNLPVHHPGVTVLSIVLALGGVIFFVVFSPGMDV